MDWSLVGGFRTAAKMALPMERSSASSMAANSAMRTAVSTEPSMVPKIRSGRHLAWLMELQKWLATSSGAAMVPWNLSDPCLAILMAERITKVRHLATPMVGSIRKERKMEWQTAGPNLMALHSVKPMAGSIRWELWMVPSTAEPILTATSSEHLMVLRKVSEIRTGIATACLTPMASWWEGRMVPRLVAWTGPRMTTVQMLEFLMDKPMVQMKRSASWWVLVTVASTADESHRQNSRTRRPQHQQPCQGRHRDRSSRCRYRRPAGSRRSHRRQLQLLPECRDTHPDNLQRHHHPHRACCIPISERSPTRTNPDQRTSRRIDRNCRDSE
mmetsp:Transcript_12023/g.34749  ORF Transcript_12023/g.34749 Transcript_12023/m.34749 type:complete len:329 (-) Transcript_12023:4978-5964(-)